MGVDASGGYCDRNAMNKGTRCDCVDIDARLRGYVSRVVWARGPCQVGNCCVEGAVVSARWWGGLRCVAAVCGCDGRTAVTRVVCLGL